MEINGIVVLDKPRGLTSHDCVARIRKLAKTKKVGHTGTLDPEVTGVLPICIGQATRLVEFMNTDEKEYVAEVTLGRATTTEDQTGETIEDQPVDPPITEKQLREHIMHFKGERQQTPPMYSAVKVNGKRLYEWARQGIEIERPTRQITIHEIELLNTQLDRHDPRFRIRVRCSKGTYIRTLAVDLGRSIGFPAHMSYLQRTQSGVFHLHEASSFTDLENWDTEDWQTKIKPMDHGISTLPTITLNAEQAKRVKVGQTLKLSSPVMEDQYYRIYDEQGQFIAVYTGQEPRLIRPKKVFAK